MVSGLKLLPRLRRAVLHRRVAAPGVELGEADLRFLWQLLRKVLHHALESRRRFELGLRGIGILGVDKLRDDAPGALQSGDVAVHGKHQVVHVPWEGRVARGVGNIPIGECGAAPKHWIQLIIFDVERETRSVIAYQPRNAALCVFGSPVHSHGVHGEALLRRDTQGRTQGPEEEPVGVLEEDHPLLTLLLEAPGQARAVEQGMDIAVVVRLRLELPRISRDCSQVRLGVYKTSDLLLLQHMNLVPCQGEVVVLLQKGNRIRMRVVRGHDDKRDRGRLPRLRLECKD
mmetsp:Transcript_124520/g.277812  ORF Transcript_124520/g.277812 Transcript_124520/m.277812 type:complete len:287 (+) Transcript_124520:555-1415(+)